MQPELVADYGCHTGENPLWHPDEGAVYWTDIPTGRLFRFDPDTGDHEQVYDGDVVGGFTVQADGDLLLFGAGGSIRTWRDGVRETIVDEIPAERDTRFNDVIADPEGRVFAGTMSTADRDGALYRVDPDGSYRRVIDGVDVPNGMGFTDDCEQFYFTDSGAGTIYRYDYDRATGEISDPEPLVEVPDDAGVPDGMTVDETGHIWSARWDGGCLVRYAPDGTEDRRVSFPADRVSSVTFGGPDYATAYVTTAGGDEKDTYGEGAGALFRLDPPVDGRPEFRSRVAELI